MSRQKNIMDFGHISVLPRQTVGLLTGERQGRCRVIDCTLGCGGHSALILKKLPEALLLGIDRDADALARAEKLWRLQTAECGLRNPISLRSKRLHRRRDGMTEWI